MQDDLGSQEETLESRVSQLENRLKNLQELIVDARKYLRFDPSIGYQQLMERYNVALAEIKNESMAGRREEDASGIRHTCDDGVGSDRPAKDGPRYYDQPG